MADSSDGKHLATPLNSTWTNALEARRFSSAVEKMNTNNFQDHLAHFRRMEAFYRDRNIVSKLEDGEILFAIIVPKPDDDVFCTHLR